VNVTRPSQVKLQAPAISFVAWISPSQAWPPSGWGAGCGASVAMMVLEVVELFSPGSEDLQLHAAARKGITAQITATRTRAISSPLVAGRSTRCLIFRSVGFRDCIFASSRHYCAYGMRTRVVAQLVHPSLRSPMIVELTGAWFDGGTPVVVALR
jgi:hypothetical protein